VTAGFALTEAFGPMFRTGTGFKIVQSHKNLGTRFRLRVRSPTAVPES
jgi:hypothetical protein